MPDPIRFSSSPPSLPGLYLYAYDASRGTPTLAPPFGWAIFERSRFSERVEMVLDHDMGGYIPPTGVARYWAGPVVALEIEDA